MKTNCITALALSGQLLFSSQLLTCFAQGTAFTYQGRLSENGAAANGIYDLRFVIYDSSGAGNVVAGPLTNSATPVGSGLFTAALDFGGGVFTGADRWLEIAARTNGGGAFVALAPRQRLAAAPYAITAGNITPGGCQAPTATRLP
jgi:hypothetical protein